MMMFWTILTLIAAYSVFLVILNLRSCWEGRSVRAINAGRTSTLAQRRAFSLVELLVVVAIIAILIGLLLPTLRGVRQAARHVKAVSDVRQLLHAYTLYHQSNHGWLLLGYTPPTVQGQPMVVRDPVSGHSFGLPVADRYPWRLASYCDNIWAILYGHRAVPSLPQPEDQPIDALLKAYMLSLSPGFGLNAIFLGGHVGFAGFAGPTGDQPNTGRHVAFRASEVRRPSQQIVFAETQARNGPFVDPQEGLHFVTPPRANGLRWMVQGGRFVLTSSMITGLPQGRFGSRSAVGFFDGHVESLLPAQLTDMRLWAPRADHWDYDY